MPPACVQLARIASVLGAVPKPAAKGDIRAQASAAGIPVADALPNDPDLAFLDDSIQLGQDRNGVIHGR